MQQPAGRKKRGCPSVEDIQEKVFEELADQLCILRELGWFDMNYQLDNATVTADILSLPANVKIMKLSSIHSCYVQVSQALLNGQVEECVQDTLIELVDNSKFDSCEDDFSQDELTALSAIASLYAGVTCFTSRSSPHNL